MALNDQPNIQLTIAEISDKIQTLKKSKGSTPNTCVKVSKRSKDSGDAAVRKSKKSSKCSRLVQTKPKSKNSQTSDATFNLVEVLDNEIECDVSERPRSRSSQHSSIQQEPSEMLTTGDRNDENNLGTDCSQYYDSHINISPSCNFQKKSSSKAKKAKVVKLSKGETLEKCEMPGCRNDFAKKVKVSKKLQDSTNKKRKIETIARREEKTIALEGKRASPVLDGALFPTSNRNSKTKTAKLSKNNPSIKNKKHISDKRKIMESPEIENTKKMCLDGIESAETSSAPTARPDSLYQSVDIDTAAQQKNMNQKLSKKKQNLKEKKQKFSTPMRAIKYGTVKAGHIYKKKSSCVSMKRKNALCKRSNTKTSSGKKQKRIVKNIKDTRKRNKITPKKKNKNKGIVKSKTTKKHKNTIPKRKT